VLNEVFVIKVLHGLLLLVDIGLV